MKSGVPCSNGLHLCNPIYKFLINRMLRYLKTFFFFLRSKTKSLFSRDSQHNSMDSENDDRLVSVPDDIKESLEAYAEYERGRQDNEIIREMITWKSLANKILRNEVQKRGYYKKGVLRAVRPAPSDFIEVAAVAASGRVKVR